MLLLLEKKQKIYRLIAHFLNWKWISHGFSES